jgi:N-acetylneuraminic acid mutarotase
MERAWTWLWLCCCACSASGNGGGDGGASAAELASCKPTAARCAGLGDVRPERLSEHTAVYDPERLELIVFGGTDSVPAMCNLGGPTRYLFNTWIYDDACGKWQRIKGQSPSPIGRHMAAFGDGSMWVFGGRFRDAQQASGPYTLYSDLFRLDVAARSWHSVDVQGEAPPARSSGALVWDTKRKRLWLFGGNASSDGASYQPLADVWSFDPRASSWKQEQPNGQGPPARLFHAAIYDERRDALIVYGGTDAGAFSADARAFGDLWALSLQDLGWQRLHPGGGTAPDERFWAALAYEKKRGTYLLFGGHDDQALGNRNDTWRYDPDAREWQRLGEGDSFNKQANAVCDFPPDFATIDAQAPERRSAHSLVWSEACGHALLFGGKTDCGAIDDVWSFDGKHWQEKLAAREGEACLRASSDASACTALCDLPTGS